MKGHKERRPSLPSFRTAQVLIVLILTLAVFAMLLQLLGGHTPQSSHIHLHASVAREHEQYVRLPHHEDVGHRVNMEVEQRRPDESSRMKTFKWKPPGVDPSGPKVAFMVTTADSLTQIQQWLAYHRLIGVAYFYMFVDGGAAQPHVLAALQTVEGVKVTPVDDKLKARHAKSRIWNETWLSAFFHKPCNHELFVLQSLNMEIAIDMATQDGMEWVLHIDTDELVLPSGSHDFSLQKYLASLPPDVDNVVLPNYESLPEKADVKNPFLEVTLFKKNYDHVVSDLYFKNYHTVAHANPNYFITYGNGKSAARMKGGLRSNGAHRFHNYYSHPKEITSDESAVLHYTYNRFQDLKSRRDRCDCAPTEKDSERCFILPFDRQAFLAASLKSDEELHQWFRERLLWEDHRVVADLIKKGLFMRTYLPQVVIKGILAAEQEGRQEAVSAQALPEPQEKSSAEVDQMPKASKKKKKMYK